MTPLPRHWLRSLLIGSVGLPLIVLLFGHQFLRTPLMSATSSSHGVATTLLAKKGLHLQSLKVLQSLWAGYGEICRLEVTSGHGAPPNKSPESSSAGSAKTLSHESQSHILKLITPPPTKASDEGHSRKILSYQVEQYFYSRLAPQLPGFISAADCLMSINEHHPDGTMTIAMILTDLRKRFPVAGEKREMLSPTQVYAALDWLSGFHGFWWSRTGDLENSSLILPPLEEVQQNGHDVSSKSVWLNGGYTYLATRRKEYTSLQSDKDSEWSEVLTNPVQGLNLSLAELAASFLAPKSTGLSPIRNYQTLIHGDVKSENLFTSESGEEVAFYDFQYTGLGLGVCDLAKLFTCSVPKKLLHHADHVPDELNMQEGERKLLERYWKNLKDVGQSDYDWKTLVFHWEVALVDWLRFQASWGFWGNTGWLESRVRCILQNPEWKEKLIRSTSE
jgi:hypothetical protein